MNKPILCIGTYAQTPFHMEKIGRNVFCIEELCYCIVQNAFLIDEESIVTDVCNINISDIRNVENSS